MRKTLTYVFVLALLAAPVAAQKVSVDYSRDFDFHAAETFQYVDSDGAVSAEDSIMHDRIVGMIKDALVAGGNTEVDENPDLFVTYNVQAQERKQFNTTSMGMDYGGYYGGWGRYGGGWGGGSSVTRETSFVEGTLVVDAFDPETKKLVWRGVSTQVMKAKPEKQAKQVEKALSKMAKQWQKIEAEDKK